MSRFDYFDRTFCVSLDSQPQRWEAFQKAVPTPWPFPAVERISAVDGRRCVPAPWWSVGKAAWGCYQSHLQIVERCLRDKINSCLIFEDDAVFAGSFCEQAAEFVNALPNDWEMIYLGGQHLDSIRHPPVPVNEKVCIPYNVNRTHAWAIRGQGIKRVRDHLGDSKAWTGGHHVDHHLGEMVRKREFPIYTPREWMVGQDEGLSSISLSRFPVRYFETPTQMENFPANVVVLSGDEKCDAMQQMLQSLIAEGFFHAIPPSLLTSSVGDKWVGSVRCELFAWLRYATGVAKGLQTAAITTLPWSAELAAIFESLLGKRLRTIHVDSRWPDKGQIQIAELRKFCLDSNCPAQMSVTSFHKP